MLTRSRPTWELPESAATDEADFLNRRDLCKTIAAGSILAGSASLMGASSAFAATENDPSAHLYPAKRNEAYTLDRDITPEKITTTYNNFYEFGSHKNIWKAAQKLKTRPWDVTIDGMGRKGDEGRYRHAAEIDAAGRTPVPAPLRRGMGHRRSLDRVSDEGRCWTTPNRCRGPSMS